MDSTSPVRPEPTDVLDLLDTALTPNEAAKKLRVSLPSIWRYLLDGKLASLKIGHRRLIPLSAIRAFVQVGPTKGSKPTPTGHRSESVRNGAADAALAECKALGV